MKTSVIIPCFNEEDNLQVLFSTWLENISEKNIEVIFVNNGSSDNSKNILNELSLKYKDLHNYFRIINLRDNQGYGGGIQKGLDIADGDILCWCHADNQTKVGDVIKIIELYVAQSEMNVLFKGTRMSRSQFDYFFTYVMSFFVRIITGYYIPDINAQPKVFLSSFYSHDVNYSKDFLFDLDFLLDIKQKEIEIIEHEVTNLDREFGTPKGGGSLRGKFKLSTKTISYLLGYRNG
jgi:glycosyltransferase involved in cell wall biosynthesis